MAACCGLRDYCTPHLDRRTVAQSLIICQLYASCLAVISVSAKPRWSRLVTKHINTIMLALLCVYAYRDLWPLTTFTLDPKDASEGWILFAKIIVLFVTAVIVPLFIPRQYIPVDPKVESGPPSGLFTGTHISVSGSNARIEPGTNRILVLATYLYLFGSGRFYGIQNSASVSRPTSTVGRLRLCEKSGEICSSCTFRRSNYM
jgi:hypothetical protein